VSAAADLPKEFVVAKGAGRRLGPADAARSDRLEEFEFLHELGAEARMLGEDLVDPDRLAGGDPFDVRFEDLRDPLLPIGVPAR